MIYKKYIKYLSIILCLFAIVFSTINCEDDDSGVSIKHAPIAIYPKILKDSTNKNRTPKICWDLFCNTSVLTGQTEPNFTQEYLDERTKDNDPLEKLYFEWTPSGNATNYEIIINDKLFCKIPAFTEPYSISNIDENNPKATVKNEKGKIIGTVYFKAIPQNLLTDPNKISTPFNYVYHLELNENPDLTNYKNIAEYFDLKISVVAWKWYVAADNSSKKTNSNVEQFIIQDVIKPSFKDVYGITKKKDNNGNYVDNKIDPYTEDQVLEIPNNPDPNNENNFVELGCKVTDDVGVTIVNIYYQDELVNQIDYSGPSLPEEDGYTPFSLTFNPRVVDPSYFGNIKLKVEICDAADNCSKIIYTLLISK